ncbi:MAG: DUF5309 family protein [Planctomycetota bacterium]|nr:DUF5309 family protein [Planctomycetota bacterium]
MGFFGKATYNAGSDLPELVEDVSDLISIVSPFETPLLDRLGDSRNPATNTVHEWIEDTLLPNADTINQTTFTPNAQDATLITVTNGSRFQVGDMLRPGNAAEVMLVTGIVANTLTVIRRYGGTPASALANGLRISILGNPAIEGADATSARFTNRSRRQNYSQIFAATVEVTGTMQAIKARGIADEFEYQKSERLRELLRDLENCVINGTAPVSQPQGSPTTRRTMNGIIRSIQTNQFTPGQGGFPAGGGAGAELNENLINTALRQVWEQSSSRVDTILVNGAQKRRINQFISSTSRHYAPGDRKLSELVSIYESDFGACNLILSRWVPADTVLMIDSTRISVMPLIGRSFHFKQLATTGDAVSGQVLGEYTMEMRNESAHGLIRGLTQ